MLSTDELKKFCNNLKIDDETRTIVFKNSEKGESKCYITETIPMQVPTPWEGEETKFSIVITQKEMRIERAILSEPLVQTGIQLKDLELLNTRLEDGEIHKYYEEEEE